jgi:hypothetical protein
MSMFWLWIKAVGKHWKRELLGGALIGLLALFSELSGITVAPRVYEIGAVIVLFYAMFLAWRDEHLKATGLETAEKARIENETTPMGKLLGSYLAAQAEREQTHAMQELASEMRASRTHDRLNDAARRVIKSGQADTNAQQASKLAALYSRGKELYEMKLTENVPSESWILSVEGWKRDVAANLTKIETTRFDAIIPEGAIGHPGAPNRVHGDMRGRLGVWLDRLDKIIEHYANLVRQQ